MSVRFGVTVTQPVCGARACCGSGDPGSGPPPASAWDMIPDVKGGAHEGALPAVGDSRSRA